jgi:hypothetical protein
MIVAYPLLLALFGHAAMSDLSLLSGVKRKSHFRAAKTGFDPTATLAVHCGTNLMPVLAPIEVVV